MQSEWHLGDFIEQQGRVLCLFELTEAGLVSAGERALLVTEQHCFKHIVRNRRAVDRDRRLRRALRMTMDAAEHDFLADTRFASDHHRRIGLRDPARELEHATAERVDGDHVVFERRRRHRQPAVDARHQHFGLERLDQVVGRAVAQCTDRTLDGFISGHQYHWQIAVAAADLAQQGVTIHRLHLNVADDEVELLIGQHREGRAAVRSTGSVKAGQRSGVEQGLAQRMVVFDYQDLGGVAGHQVILRGVGRRARKRRRRAFLRLLGTAMVRTAV